MQSHKRAQTGSKKARNSAARLAASQAVYQAMSNEQSFQSVSREYLDHRLTQNQDEEHDLIQPDGVLFQYIVTGVGARLSDLNVLVEEALTKKDESAGKMRPEPLLMSIMLCGSYELMAHHEIDAPIIISDYIDVAHAFYGEGEAGLVNGVLDKLSGQVRD